MPLWNYIVCIHNKSYHTIHSLQKWWQEKSHRTSKSTFLLLLTVELYRRSKSVLSRILKTLHLSSAACYRRRHYDLQVLFLERHSRYLAHNSVVAMYIHSITIHMRNVSHVKYRKKTFWKPLWKPILRHQKSYIIFRHLNRRLLLYAMDSLTFKILDRRFLFKLVCSVKQTQFYWPLTDYFLGFTNVIHKSIASFKYNTHASWSGT